MKRKTILFVAQNLYIGGIQTALANLLKVLVEKDEYDIELFSFGKGPLAEKIPDSVLVTYGNRPLGLAATSFSEVIRSRKPTDIAIRVFMMLLVRVIGSEHFYNGLLKRHRITKHYDVAISFFNDSPAGYFNRGTNMFVSDYVTASEKAAWLHSDPIDGGFDKEYCRKIYKHFDRIICVSKAVKDKFDLMLPEYDGRTEVVYNVFDSAEIRKRALDFDPIDSKDMYNIVTVCRIDNVSKRVDKIVGLCARLKSEGIVNFRWRIVGGGPDMKADKKAADAAGVDSLLIFEGERSNPYPYISNSDLCALYSAYEGYPMVVGEALILDVPVLTSAYAAAHEQIPQEKGYIADDDEDFYRRLKKYILSK